jgi:hypothetical protein
MALTISAITALGGMPSVSSGNERGLRRGVVGALRRCHASIAPRRTATDPGDLFLERIGRERGDDRAAARQDAEDRSSTIPRAMAGAESIMSFWLASGQVTFC